MACGCGKQAVYNMTSAQLEAQRLQAERDAAMAAETAMAASGEHNPTPDALRVV